MKLKAFTLVEMLIVMGIIIIIMVVGIASGRYALQRANRIEHENSVENIYQGLQSYYTEEREYPVQQSVETLVDTTLTEYIDAFDGGTEASYSYTVDDTQQEAIVCVTLGGIGDKNQLGVYCTGDGLGSTVITGAPSAKYLEYGESEYSDVAENLFTVDNASAWTPSDEWTADDPTIEDTTGDDRPPDPASPF
ncbi:MAG: hypothetical protein PHP08_03630 [Candidatus Dojkabacteria bacterium]|nr:hypothetical protein [Candidatus Dojkabacteria bacterium]